VIVVHHLNNSRSQRVLWLLEELGLEYEIKRHQRDVKTMLAESGAILEYLVTRYGGGKLIPPEGTPDRLRYTYWMHFAEGTAMPPLVMKLVFSRLPKGPMPFFARPIARAIAERVLGSFIQPNIERNLDYVESELGSSAWFAGGEFTAADVQMSFPLEAAAARGGLDERRPKLTAFVERIHARPAYARALERGGKYELLR